MPTIVNIPGEFAAGSTPTYTAVLRYPSQQPVPGSALTSLTLTIADTLTGEIINGVQDVDILNTGRGTVDALGNLTVLLQTGDTAIEESPPPARIQRSLVFRFSYNSVSGPLSDAHQANFFLTALAAS